jgi:hypothetical protein
MSITLNPTFDPLTATQPLPAVRVGRHSIDAPDATAPLLVLMPNYEPSGETRHQVTADRVGVAAIVARLRDEQPTTRQLTSGLIGGQS